MSPNKTVSDTTSSNKKRLQRNETISYDWVHMKYWFIDNIDDDLFNIEYPKKEIDKIIKIMKKAWIVYIDAKVYGINS